MDNNIVYSPFNLKIVKMDKVMLINIEKDPDEVYIAFEPQSLYNPIYGKGIRILAYRKDGYVDIYEEDKIPKDEEEKLEVTGKGLGDYISLDMENAQFDVTEYGPDVHFKFIDKLGREIELKIKENSRKKTKPFSILAPVGVSSINPVILPVFFMYDFYFVRRSKTEVVIRIGDKYHNADEFLPIDGNKMYFMRYSRETVIGEWNRATNSFIKPLIVGENMEASEEETIYELEKEEGNYSIKSMRTKGEKSGIKVEFIPPFKDVTSLKKQEECQGEFIIKGEESVGSIEGEYRVKRQDENVQIIVIPSKGWIPNEKKFFIKVIYFFGKVFKNWSKTYKWTANIRLNGNEHPKINSKWERTGKDNKNKKDN